MRKTFKIESANLIKEAKENHINHRDGICTTNKAPQILQLKGQYQLVILGSVKVTHAKLDLPRISTDMHFLIVKEFH